MPTINNILFQDAHLHLTDQAQANFDLPKLLEIADNNNIHKLYINTALENEWDLTIELASKNKNISPYIGIHPWYADNLSINWLERLENKLLATNCGIGEIGLDKKCKAPKIVQEEVFQKQFALGCKLNRPITIHCLGRWGYLADYLAQQKILPPIILHSFNSSAEMAKRFTNLGCCLSFSLQLLKRDNISSYLQNIATSNILLESDMNQQTKTNYEQGKWPLDLIESYHLLAKIKDIKVTELAQELWNNGKIFKT